MEPPTCTSCKQRTTNAAGSTKFLCPACSKVEIVRCKHCRDIAAKYVCQECNFEGPN
ncbi:RNA-binding protein [Candidatus Woesearchaeota archaeon]|nr:RNA-binding protein [Candidatus Woesearchaeota archaeon]